MQTRATQVRAGLVAKLASAAQLGLADKKSGCGMARRGNFRAARQADLKKIAAKANGFGSNARLRFS